MTQETYTFAGFKFPRKIPRLLLTGHEDRRRAGKADTRYRVDTAYCAAPTLPRKEIGFYLESDFQPGLRWKWCDQINPRIGHTGWYTDAEGISGTIRGIVTRLPHDRGFLAGWSMGEGMSSTVEYEIYPDEIAASRYADALAQEAAEKEREYCAKWRAALRWQEIKNELDETRKKRNQLMSALRLHTQKRPRGMASAAEWREFSAWETLRDMTRKGIKCEYRCTDRLHEERQKLEAEFGADLRSFEI